MYRSNLVELLQTDLAFHEAVQEEVTSQKPISPPHHLHVDLNSHMVDLSAYYSPIIQCGP